MFDTTAHEEHMELLHDPDWGMFMFGSTAACHTVMPFVLWYFAYYFPNGDNFDAEDEPYEFATKLSSTQPWGVTAHFVAFLMYVGLWSPILFLWMLLAWFPEQTWLGWWFSNTLWFAQAFAYGGYLLPAWMIMIGVVRGESEIDDWVWYAMAYLAAGFMTSFVHWTWMEDV